MFILSFLREVLEFCVLVGFGWLLFRVEHLMAFLNIRPTETTDLTKANQVKTLLRIIGILLLASAALVLLAGVFQFLVHVFSRF